ncbi:MAG: PfkB family carbohydrate kinase [Candidatus Methanosuratincola sp.]|jgi:sugar/nucleoside kinase (ribokinase family)
MSILVVGSIAFDTIETPFGSAQEVIGGSATYFSLAASLFTKVGVVAVVGEDFGREHLDFLSLRGVDIEGVKRAEGKTFRWHGRYGYDLSNPETLGTYLNVFESFDPVIPPSYRGAEFVFLANIDPEIQLDVLRKLDRPQIVACDTMNYWIEKKPLHLKRLLRQVDILIINDSETRALAQEPLLVKAARAVLDMGPKVLIVKRGEYGALMFSQEGIFWAPCYPLEEVVDPTGAGDSFAGGFLGSLVASGSRDVGSLKRSVVYGSVVASFTVEDFSIRSLSRVTHEQITKRLSTFLSLSRLE